jgi:hypothetical protein
VQDLSSQVTQIITRSYVAPEACYRHCILIKTVHFVMSLKTVSFTKCAAGLGFLYDKLTVLRPMTKGTSCRRHTTKWTLCGMHTSPVSLSTHNVYCNIIYHRGFLTIVLHTFLRSICILNTPPLKS